MSNSEPVVHADQLKECWHEQLRSNDIKYFVLKVDDLFNSITDEQTVEFNDLLGTYNDYRESKLGKGVNKYFVANRDEFPQLKDAHDFINFLNYCVRNHLEEYRKNEGR